jgi:hypothetical protein
VSGDGLFDCSLPSKSSQEFTEESNIDCVGGGMVVIVDKGLLAIQPHHELVLLLKVGEVGHQEHFDVHHDPVAGGRDTINKIGQFVAGWDFGWEIDAWISWDSKWTIMMEGSTCFIWMRRCLMNGTGKKEVSFLPMCFCTLQVCRMVVNVS